MSFVRIGYEQLEDIVSQVAADGETPTIIELKTLLRFAEANEEPVYLSFRHLEELEAYMYGGG